MAGMMFKTYFSMKEKDRGAADTIRFLATGQASQRFRRDHPPKQCFCLKKCCWGAAEYAAHCHRYVKRYRL